MKKSAYKRGILLLPVILLSITLSGQEVTKEYHEEYTASEATTLQLNNRYGDVIVDSWDNNQVVIDVKVTLEMPDKERAERLLEYITVEFTQNGDVISAKTVIDEKIQFFRLGREQKIQH